MTHLRILIIETESQAEHKIIRCLKVLEIVTDVKERATCHVYLQRKDLIQPPQIATPQHIRSQTDIDGEKRHYILRPSRKSESKLMLNARHKKPAIRRLAGRCL